MSIDKVTPTEWNRAVNKLEISEQYDDYKIPKHKGDPVFDSVNKPKHYNNGQVEAIDYIKQQLGETGITVYYEGSVLKYLHRWKYKTNPIEDLKKARWYLDRLIETVEED
jgi:hypothetical protein|tara:strand:+ start:5854 stop:6183 length:330 start_codon:yes stop_codon:yes gene_type:complete